MMGHLDYRFTALMDEVQELLRFAFQTTNPLTLPISGTGTAGMEAALCNFIEPGDSVLIGVNGFFSERMVEIAARLGAEVRRLDRPWGEVLTPEEIEEALRAKPAKVVALVHAETSTGALQPMEGVADIVHRFGGLLVLDVVTSLTGVPVPIDAWGVDVAYSGSQKCLSCPPGMAPLTVSPRASDVLHQRRSKVPGLYLDLSVIERYWSTERFYHHTAPIGLVFALREALRIVHEDGLEKRFERHRVCAQALWDGLQGLGLRLRIPPAHRLPTLTTVVIPEGVDDAALRRRLLDEYNIEIGGGLGPFKGQVWRIGLMGHSARKENVLLLLAALEECLPR
jgi:alanine-glyoxylate transaminase/serine-glyoxylate transaminase/serine-pyruvate transaminase